MSYRVKEKKDRNQRLLKFAQEHPDWTQDAIAKVFHIDRSRVSRILKRMKGENDAGITL